jgi:hypothetical protein
MYFPADRNRSWLLDTQPVTSPRQSILRLKIGRIQVRGHIDNVRCSLGQHYPTRLHSRDAAYPNFRDDTKPDGQTLCGAYVSGPFVEGDAFGTVQAGTDKYTNDRRVWKESEPAIDYTGSMICAMMGYASLPSGAFDGCDVTRTAFTGRA